MGIVLPDEKISFFRENGFVQIDHVLNEEELTELRDALSVVMDSNTTRTKAARADDPVYSRMLKQKANIHVDSPTVCKYAFSARFALMALDLSGAAAVRFDHNTGFWKMPGDANETAWHQDSSYQVWKEPGGLNVWIALDDVDENNGCMAFIPGSHKLGDLEAVDLVNPKSLDELLKGTAFEHVKPAVVRLKAGSCTFHDYSTFHYAHSNRTDKPRRAYSITYIPDGTTVRREVPFYPYKVGDVANSHYHPVLARREQ